MVRYRVGTRVCVPLGKTGRRKACGKIIKRGTGRFRGRKIKEYRIRFDDGDSGIYHSPEFRKERRRKFRPARRQPKHARGSIAFQQYGI